MQNLREVMRLPGWDKKLSTMLTGGMLPGVVLAYDTLSVER
jgi:hypothetical protein